ncbi:MAG: peroxiredoxin [Planctomycetes bacterium]|nr:peroxiredoxin [Planctomycetota bacterium]
MLNFKHTFSPLLILILVTSFTHAKEDLVELKVGGPAPHFVGTDDENHEWDSEKRAGKKIYVVYFYPADMTPGCTVQACSYRDALADLKRTDVEVIGVSGDAVENHQHFKNEYDLNFTLLADPDGKIAKAFGVKTSDGGSIQRQIGDQTITLERGVTAKRWTFVIDKQWQIAHKETQVNVLKDSETVLKLIGKME